MRFGRLLLWASLAVLLQLAVGCVIDVGKGPPGAAESGTGGPGGDGGDTGGQATDAAADAGSGGDLGGGDVEVPGGDLDGAADAVADAKAPDAGDDVAPDAVGDVGPPEPDVPGDVADADGLDGGDAMPDAVEPGDADAGGSETNIADGGGDAADAGADVLLDTDGEGDAGPDDAGPDDAGPDDTGDDAGPEDTGPEDADDAVNPQSFCDLAGDGAACDDGDPCTGEGECGGGVCFPGEPLPCDDGDPCTDDHCDPETGCAAVANAAPCDDGDACTTDDVCTEGTCAGVAVVCDDGDACTTNEVCAEGTCAGVAVECDDGNPCTDDGCDPQSGCTAAHNASTCDDGDPCTSADACVAGVCTGELADCDDGNPCTGDTCNGAAGCAHANLEGSCDDGDACTTGDACVAGACAGSEALSCDDGDPCTDDACDPLAACIHTQNAAPCDDGDACTDSDACVAGVCTGGPGPCDDQDDCTTDTCDAASGCVHAVVESGPCDDGDPCTGPDTCGVGGCAGALVDCDDGDPCTADVCDPVDGCQWAPADAPCDDGDPCTTDDACAAGACKGVPLCDDGDPCTAETCDPESGECSSSQAEQGTPCDADGNGCTVGDACQNGVCMPGTAAPCNDGLGCTADTCVSDDAAGYTCSNLTIIGNCVIDGACYAEGADPDNPCRACITAESMTEWVYLDGSLCEGDKLCYQGVCGCEIQCEGRTCGPDGCGGTCGTCAQGEACAELGVCGAPSEGMVAVPAGEYWVGCNTAVDNQCYPNEHPYHQVTVEAFEIGETEVTIASYMQCVGDFGCYVPPISSSQSAWGKAGEEERPAHFTPRALAQEYCSWRGMRLCSEAEWEVAARGADGRKYPWGAAPVTCEYAWMAGSCTLTSMPVGWRPGNASPFGALDMIGNIREWVADCWHADYEGAPTDGSAWTTDCASAQGVVKGGAYKSSNTKDLRASVRLPFDPAAMDESVGFRCCQRLCDCSIDGQCYQEGQTNPANECQRCTAAVSRLAWTAGPDGVVCGDDLRCAAGECACVPDCAGKECGEDGCGGSCGACSPGLGCHEDWTCGETMILIESGPFWMGCNAAVDKECDGDDEVPYREITLSAYEIDATEVAWGAYEVCDLTGPCSVTYPGKAPDHPINYMTWQQANTYCTWAGKRLCTEAEWEKAARGTDGRKYPWGNQPPTCEIANTSSCGIEVKPVGTHPLGASPYGVQDMGGSLKEWTADWYDPYYYTYGPTTDPKGLPSGSFKAVRGANKGRTSDRSTGALSSTAWDYGFRCCRSVAQ